MFIFIWISRILGIPLILLFTSLSAIKPFSLSLRQNSEIHIRLYSLPPSVPEEQLTSYFKVKVIGKHLIDIEQTLFPALTKMFGGYGNIVKSDYKKPFKIFFESPQFLLQL
jgi:hypothetical protein